MIDGLVAGIIQSEPEQRAGRADTSFVVAKVKAQAGDGEAVLVNVIAFDASVCQTLMALRDGDSVSLSGSLTPKVWTDKQGNARAVIDMVAQRVLVVSDSPHLR